VPQKRKKIKEISVRAPDYIPKKTPICKDTTGIEALDVFKVAGKVGRFFSFIMFAIGIFGSILSGYSILISANLFLNPSFGGIIGLIGALNIFGGLLLLAKK